MKGIVTILAKFRVTGERNLSCIQSVQTIKFKSSTDVPHTMNWQCLNLIIIVQPFVFLSFFSILLQLSTKPPHFFLFLSNIGRQLLIHKTLFLTRYIVFYIFLFAQQHSIVYLL